MLQNSRVFGFIPIALVLVVTAAMSAIAQSPASTAAEQKLLSAFSKKAKDYMDRERSLAASKMKPTADVAKLEQQRKLLRDAVQQSRPNAKQGEFFTPQVAPVFRKLLSNILNGPEGKEIRASLSHAEPGASAQFRVNGELPDQNGQPIQSVPPTVLQALPTLPKGIEYCIAGSTMALRDTAANLVVDFLPNALP